MNSATDKLLEARGLTKRYGSATVLDDCCLDFRRGEIHALLGANGAGKSTMVRIFAGLVAASGGAMSFDGRPYAPRSKREAELRGIEIVQQELNLIPTLSVAENLLLSRLPSTGGVIRQAELHERARAALDRVGLNEMAPDTPVGSLGVGRQQMVEIAAALDRQCRLLILDEPTAALSAAETETLFQWLEKLRGRGVGVIYISHRLDEVARIADRISVLRDGKHVGRFAAGDVATDEIVDLMTGKAASAPFHEYTSYAREAAAMRVDGLSGGPVRDVSFTVRRGERLGIAGLVGSGRTELLRLIFGADVASAGRITIGEGAPCRFRRPSEAVAAGVAMVTEDRKQNGLLLSQSIRVNTTLASMWKRFAAAGVVRSGAEEQAAREICESLETRCAGIEQRVGTLSGGNQQKVAIAKWLLRDAEVFLFDEPTRGIDIGARRRIYRLLETLASKGKGVVIVSSESEELRETCDRIAVMSNGQLVETFARPDWSDERIMQAAFSRYLDRKPEA